MNEESFTYFRFGQNTDAPVALGTEDGAVSLLVSAASAAELGECEHYHLQHMVSPGFDATTILI